MTSLAVILLCNFIISSTNGQTDLEAELDSLGIIGGHNVTIEEAPFMAALFARISNENTTRQRFVCGASIIHEQFVLTAAHCCELEQYADLEIKVGIDNNENNDTKNVYAATNVSIHELYDTNVPDYDICIIKLNESLQFGPSVSNISLADESVEMDNGTTFNTLGWGFTKLFNPKSKSNHLLEVSIPFVPTSECQKGTYYYISPRMICAGATNMSANPGDSGGPLTLNNNTILAGITSFGPQPFKWRGVFVKVASLLTWINEKMAKLS